MEQPLDVGCYSGGRYGDRPQWVELNGQRLAVEVVNREYRQEERLVFEVTLENEQRLALYYYPQQDTWLGVSKE